MELDAYNEEFFGFSEAEKRVACQAARLHATRPGLVAKFLKLAREKPEWLEDALFRADLKSGWTGQITRDDE